MHWESMCHHNVLLGGKVSIQVQVSSLYFYFYFYFSFYFYFYDYYCDYSAVTKVALIFEAWYALWSFHCSQLGAKLECQGLQPCWIIRRALGGTYHIHFPCYLCCFWV